jgi:trans-2,3-dihydro-3-hydroxyanthranilate isomerase
VASLSYHLLNVFTRGGDRLSGNPLCVFEDGSALDGARMQALARQFNLSETTFLLPSTRASAGVRIFTPDFEMAFAGHPTLGSAHVVRLLGRGGDALDLEMPAGVIPVRARGDEWTLSANPASTREVDATGGNLATALGLGPGDIVGASTARRSGPRPLWVDSGSEQLLVPLASVEAVQRVIADAAALEALRSRQGRRMAYVFAEAGDGRVVSRFLFEADGAMREDPATGSACANLGGWYLAVGAASLPLFREVHQGDLVRRPSTLRLSIDADRRVRVAGDVVHLGAGRLEL